MKKLIAALACLAAACGQPAPTQSSDQAPAEAAATAPGAAGVEIDRGMLLGSWGDNGDCTRAVTFADDGSYRMFDGAEGRWSVAGDRITMEGPAGSYEIRVTSLNATQLLIGNPDGSIGLSQRC
ncbi:MAG: hypothetical protein AB7J28_10980 [Hyphomonadaceae bacterium]